MNKRPIPILFLLLILSGCAKKIILQSAASGSEFEIFTAAGFKASSKADDSQPLRSILDGNLNSAWKSKPLQDPSWVSVRFPEKVNLSRIQIHWGSESAKEYEVQVSNDGEDWNSVAGVTDGKPDQKRYVKFSSVKCYHLRILCKQRIGGDFYSIKEIELNPLESRPPIKASASTGESGYEGEMAFDGNPTTRWSSEQGVDPQWVAVDLGEKTKVGSMKVKWEKASAQIYDIQTSNDGTNWNTVATVSDGAESETRLIRLEESAESRHFRILGKKRSTIWGYSIWEVEFFSPGLFVAP